MSDLKTLTDGYDKITSLLERLTQKRSDSYGIGSGAIFMENYNPKLEPPIAWSVLWGSETVKFSRNRIRELRPRVRRNLDTPTR